MKLWPYYTNVYYKYIHGSFNTNNENYFKNIYILHNIRFVKLIIAQKPKLITKIKFPCF